MTGDEPDRNAQDDAGATAEKNQQPPIAHVDDDEVESGDVEEADTAVQESKAAGPDAGDAVPENTKEGGPEEMAADNVELVDETGEVNEGSLQTDEQEEEVASDEPDET